MLGALSAAEVDLRRIYKHNFIGLSSISMFTRFSLRTGRPQCWRFNHRSNLVIHLVALAFYVRLNHRSHWKCSQSISDYHTIGCIKLFQEPVEDSPENQMIAFHSFSGSKNVQEELYCDKRRDRYGCLQFPIPFSHFNHNIYWVFLLRFYLMIWLSF